MMMTQQRWTDRHTLGLAFVCVELSYNTFSADLLAPPPRIPALPFLEANEIDYLAQSLLPYL
jgi:hypothetical protein